MSQSYDYGSVHEAKFRLDGFLSLDFDSRMKLSLSKLVIAEEGVLHPQAD